MRRRHAGRCRQDGRDGPERGPGARRRPGKGERAAAGRRGRVRPAARPRSPASSARASRATYRRLMRATQAHGAGESGPGQGHPDARRLGRRRRPGAALAGQHGVLLGAGRPGPGPGRALPPGHDGAVLADGAGDRAAARPVPQRPALRARRHAARPGLPGLGHGRARSPGARRASRSTRPRSGISCSARPTR